MVSIKYEHRTKGQVNRERSMGRPHLQYMKRIVKDWYAGAMKKMERMAEKM